MSHRSNLESDLLILRDKQGRIRADVRRLETELDDRIEALKYADDRLHTTRLALHRLDGAEKNCGHEFVVEPSGRGIGFDSVCLKCQWVENLEPSY